MHTFGLIKDLRYPYVQSMWVRTTYCIQAFQEWRNVSPGVIETWRFSCHQKLKACWWSRIYLGLNWTSINFDIKHINSWRFILKCGGPDVDTCKSKFTKKVRRVWLELLEETPPEGLGKKRYSALISYRHYDHRQNTFTRCFLWVFKFGHGTHYCYYFRSPRRGEVSASFSLPLSH